MDNIVVTGATGMIGAALISAAVDDPSIEEIYAIVRPGSDKIKRIPQMPRVIVVECDVRNYNQLPELIHASIDIFFHLAWPRTSTYAESYEDIYEKSVNVLCVLEALHAASQMGCRTFVGAGSQSEYGIVERGKISPDTPCNPVRADGILHLAAGRLVEYVAAKMNMNSAWMRIFSVYGINDRENSLVKSTIRKLYSGENCSFTKSEQIWDFLYESDAGSAFLMTGENVIGNKTYCLGSGKARPLKEFLEIMRDMISPNAKLGIGEMPYPENPVMNLQCDISALTTEIGWQPSVSFEDGIRAIRNAEYGEKEYT